MDWTLNFSGILNCSLALRESARLFLLLRGWFWGFDGVMALDKPLRGQNVPWDNKKAHKTTVIKPVFERTSSDTNACCSGKIRITLFSSSAMRGRLRPRGRSRCWEAVISKNATKHSLPLFFTRISSVFWSWPGICLSFCCLLFLLFRWQNSKLFVWSWISRESNDTLAKEKHGHLSGWRRPFEHREIREN